MRKLREWIRHPYGWALLPLYLCTAASIGGAITCAILGERLRYAFIAYIMYGLAAILLGYTVYTVVYFVPIVKKNMREKLSRHAFTDKLCAQYDFRTVVFAIGSFAINVGNAVVYAVVGLLELSVWHSALCVYYLLLVAMRGVALWYHGKKRKYGETETQLRLREARRYGVIGGMLVAMPIALSGAILEIVWHDRAFVRAGMLIYVAAAYTTIKISMSIRNFFKAKQSDDYTVRAIRNVNLADALVSVLALQTAMLHEFSPMKRFGTANAITGGAVCLLTAALGVTMIVGAALQSKRVRAQEEEENYGE